MVRLTPLAVKFPPQVESASSYLEQSGRVGQLPQFDWELVTPSEKLLSVNIIVYSAEALILLA